MKKIDRIGYLGLSYVIEAFSFGGTKKEKSIDPVYLILNTVFGFILVHK